MARNCTISLLITAGVLITALPPTECQGSTFRKAMEAVPKIMGLLKFPSINLNPFKKDTDKKKYPILAHIPVNGFAPHEHYQYPLFNDYDVLIIPEKPNEGHGSLKVPVEVHSQYPYLPQHTHQQNQIHSPNYRPHNVQNEFTHQPLNDYPHDVHNPYSQQQHFIKVHQDVPYHPPNKRPHKPKVTQFQHLKDHDFPYKKPVVPHPHEQRLPDYNLPHTSHKQVSYGRPESVHQHVPTKFNELAYSVPNVFDHQDDYVRESDVPKVHQSSADSDHFKPVFSQDNYHNVQEPPKQSLRSKFKTNKDFKTYKPTNEHRPFISNVEHFESNMKKLQVNPSVHDSASFKGKPSKSEDGIGYGFMFSSHGVDPKTSKFLSEETYLEPEYERTGLISAETLSSGNQAFGYRDVSPSNTFRQSTFPENNYDQVLSGSHKPEDESQNFRPAHSIKSKNNFPSVHDLKPKLNPSESISKPKITKPDETVHSNFNNQHYFNIDDQNPFSTQTNSQETFQTGSNFDPNNKLSSYAYDFSEVKFEHPTHPTLRPSKFQNSEENDKKAIQSDYPPRYQRSSSKTKVLTTRTPKRNEFNGSSNLLSSNNELKKFSSQPIITDFLKRPSNRNEQQDLTNLNIDLFHSYKRPEVSVPIPSSDHKATASISGLSFAFDPFNDNNNNNNNNNDDDDNNSNSNNNNNNNNNSNNNNNNINNNNNNNIRPKYQIFDSNIPENFQNEPQQIPSFHNNSKKSKYHVIDRKIPRNTPHEPLQVATSRNSFKTYPDISEWSKRISKPET